jgi:dipeptidyl aminopeptidase/acylaminoacyl peptidase
LAIGLSLGTGGVANSAACTDLLPAIPPAGGTKRPLVADDLLRLRDLGSKTIGDQADAVLAVSPDGKQVAFQLRRVDPDTDSICLGLVVQPLSSGKNSFLVDTGGDYIRLVHDMPAITGFPSGYIDVITPRWSPDGKSIAYRRRDNGLTRAWVAAVDGSGARPVSALSFDVEDIAWSTDGAALIVTGRPGMADALRAIDKEGESGFLYDDRYYPYVSKRPFPRDDIPRQRFAIPISGGQAEAVTAAATRSIAPVVPDKALMTVGGPSGQIAWTDLSDPNNVTSPSRLHVTDAAGRTKTCEDQACDGGRSFWWRDQSRLIIQRSEGWARADTGLYEWNLATGKVRKILSTEDVLQGCQLAQEALVCLHEASLQPREIVRVDLASGEMDHVFDPNPVFRGLRLGSVQRLRYINSFGVEGFADLVLPPDHQPGQKHPLVVVQYVTRGFLRGGTDDEYPIQLLAANGIAVLSFEDMLSPGYLKGGQSWDEIAATDQAGWLGHRSTQDLLEKAIDMAVETGAIDREQLGISGLSAGSTNTRWALLNSHLFSAAAISTCCEDMVSSLSIYGPAGAAEMRRRGYPGLTDDGTAFWQPGSFHLNARRMKTPLLMQLPDNEFLAALESVAALREQNAPVEMYVFPDEYHEKWHPIHRRAIYARAVDWFKFWLMGQEDDNPAKQDQYKRWRSLRANLPGSGAPPGR